MSRVLLTLALCLTLVAAGARAADNWIVYYNDQATPDQFKPYRIAVFDSDHHPPQLRTIAAQGTVLLGYLSLGEVEKTRPYFSRIESSGSTLMENPNWPGSYFIDVRDTRWHDLVLNELVPAILASGFHGLFMDTLDNPPHLERTDPQKFAGMTKAAAQLVKSIRARFPAMPMMQNRGFELLPDTLDDIDMLLGESILGGYDFANKRYVRVDAATSRTLLGWLRDAKKRKPDLQVMTLDYADPKDKRTIGEFYRDERKNGFWPYVATIGLDAIIPEPKP